MTEFINRTVGELIEAYALDLQQFIFFAEPRGITRGFFVTTESPQGTRTFRVVIPALTGLPRFGPPITREVLDPVVIEHIAQEEEP